MRCHSCGLKSEVEQAFLKQNNFLGEPRYFCPTCIVKRQTTSFISMIMVFIIFSLLAFGFGFSSPEGSAILAGNLFLISIIPLILIHELAHAVTAKLTGLPVFLILIGIGKTVWSGKFLGMEWIINSLPLGGITAIGARPTPNIRAKLFFVYLAGPASHTILAGIFYLLAKGQTAPLFYALTFANLFLLLTNLYPRKARMVTGMSGTDGWHLIRVPFWSEAELTKHYIGYYSTEALQAYTANDFDTAITWVDQAMALDANSRVARNVLGVIRMARQEYHEARLIFLQLLDAEDDPELPGFRFIILNNIAYMDAIINDAEMLLEADNFSAEAFKNLPWIPAVVGTRGTVLVELGKLDEGIDLLKQSMSLHPDKQGKALNACHLAIGEFKRGNLDQARKYLESAKTLDAKCFLIPIVEADLP